MHYMKTEKISFAKVSLSTQISELYMPRKRLHLKNMNFHRSNASDTSIVLFFF